MAIDFDALDLVRGENKARSYNKRMDELQQQVTDLQELVTQMVKELPDDKKWSFEERLKKIKERPGHIAHRILYVRSRCGLPCLPLALTTVDGIG